MIVSAYLQSDLFGKVIFILLLVLSALSWMLICYKALQIYLLNKYRIDFESILKNQQSNLLQVPVEKHKNLAYFDVFHAVQTKTKDLLKKNSALAKEQTFLSKADLDSISQLKEFSIRFFLKRLEKNLYLLALIGTLTPLLGLLGTVWGILIAFFEMQGAGNMRDAVLGGLATALTTTVLGLVVAIPALVGNSLLRNKTKDVGLKMQRIFSQCIGILELQYRNID